MSDFLKEARSKDKLEDVFTLTAREPQVIDRNEIQIYIPDCCRENWPSCPHCPRPQRKQRRNLGL